MSFKASYNKLLKKYTKISERVSNLMNIKFDSEPVYGDNDIYIKTKKKSHMEIMYIQIFRVIKYQKKMHHANARH